MGDLTSPAEGRPQPEAPERLSDRHDTSSFDCGHPDLNGWLSEQARSSEARSARTYVATLGQRVVAYYCLVAGAVVRGDLPTAKLRRNMPEPVPVVVIGRLAVDREFQGRGFGKGLLKDAVLRALGASDLVGIRAIVVHAIDEAAAEFYRRCGFLPSPLSALTFVLPIETAKQVLRRSS